MSDEIYGIESVIYRVEVDAWEKVLHVGVITPSDAIVESDLTDRDVPLKLTGGIIRDVSYEFELTQVKGSADRTFFWNAYKNRTTIELLICDLPKEHASMIGIRGPFRVLQAPHDAALEPASKRKVIVKPTLDSLIPFLDVSGTYAVGPTDLS